MSSAQRGMTLIEVMMALSVLAIGIMGLLTLIPTTTRLINDSNEYETARHAAEMKIAEIRAKGDAGSFHETTFAVDGLDLGVDFVVIGVWTECGWVTVNALRDGVTPDVGPDGTNTVRVFVRWMGAGKVDKEISVVTLVGQ